MTEGDYIVRYNKEIAFHTYKMALDGDLSSITGSGQFVQVSVPGKFLRRPISVSDIEGGALILVYKVIGQGTEVMSHMRQGDKVSLITGLGNGFDVAATKKKAMIIGGSVGVAPMMLLAKELLLRGCELEVALGFADAGTVFYAEEFERLGADVAVSTMDGSFGVKGVVTEAMSQLPDDYDYFYACGPKVMMKVLCETLTRPGEISMEERMGCGTGICYGCTCMTASGPKRVCADGPVFKKEDIVW